jgi:hypothetical protein
MFITPAALELTLRCLAPSLGGLDERPWTAESTLVRGFAEASVDMMACLGYVEREIRSTRGSSHEAETGDGARE